MGAVRVKKKYKNNDKTKTFLKKALSQEYLDILDLYGKKGVSILQNATPKDTGITATSWDYVIDSGKEKTTITWVNNSTAKNKRGYEFNIVILLQYGHATINGGWVEGHDFVNDAMKPLFDEISKEVWVELTK